MAWIFLFTAGLFEMTGVLMINQVHKERNWKSIAGLVVSFTASFLSNKEKENYLKSLDQIKV